MHRSFIIILGVLFTVPILQADPPPAPPPRAIPGITAPESHPDACVSCHVNMPDIGVDARFGPALERWTAGVEPALLDLAQRAMGSDRKLEGVHPSVSDALESVPARCLDCHGATSSEAPPFARLMHAIHLTGGEKNHFLTVFQGECTHCHKLNAATGRWAIPSAPEK